MESERGPFHTERDARGEGRREEGVFSIPEPAEQETPWEYISRVRYEFFKQHVASQERFTNNTPEALFKYRHNLIAQADREFSKGDQLLSELFAKVSLMVSGERAELNFEKNYFVLERVRHKIEDFDVELPPNMGADEKVDFFSKTKQGRDFSRGGAYGFDAYSFMMFGIPEKFLANGAVRESLRSAINNKTIYLFGGGDSVNDLLTSQEYQPKEVINIDPYISQESMGKNKSGVYRSLPVSAGSLELTSLRQDGVLPPADEIWATFSVPAYLESEEEIANTFKNIDSLLQVGGHARIFPISVQGSEANTELSNSRRQALYNGIKELVESGHYNITLVGDTLHVHKISPEAKKKRDAVRRGSLEKNEAFLNSVCPNTSDRRKMRSLKKELFKLAGTEQEGFDILEDQEAHLKDFLLLAKELSDMDVDGFSKMSTDNVRGFARVGYENVVKKSPVEFFSVASNALTSTGSLRDKAQYSKFDRINEIVKEMAERHSVAYTYRVILADIDHTFDLDNFADPWVKNFEYLQRQTKIPVVRMSEFLPTIKKEALVAKERLAGTIEKRVKSMEMALRLFHATEARARHQMELYAAIGLALRDTHSAGVLLDVQKKIYPYEQPFYNELRPEAPLPRVKFGKL